MTHALPAALTALPATAALSGSVTVPGDKSISHRAVMLGALATGRTRIRGLSQGEDVQRTAAAMRALGAEIATAPETAEVTITGRGTGALLEPATVLDMGNSGTAARLILGLLASHALFATMTGDASLVSRPMARVTEPLARMGAAFWTRSGGRLPLAVRGRADLLPLEHRLAVASAQVKSALLLAALNTAGRTTVIEPAHSRDHTERMLHAFGVTLECDDRAVAVQGEQELLGCAITVPADPSAAAFPAVAACLVPGSRIRLPDIGINPHRCGLFTTLAEMGADIRYENEREVNGEPVADLLITAADLHGVDVPPERAPSMIDEYPILAVAAACARGTTRMTGIAELRVKESDRIAMMAAGLAACGVTVDAGEDCLTVTGTGDPPAGGATVATALDHRIAMSFLILGLVARTPVTVDDAAPIATSFPGFAAKMEHLGARFRSAAAAT